MLKTTGVQGGLVVHLGCGEGSVLDAATGEILRPALPGTEGADELLVSDDVLIVKITQGRSVAAAARLGKDLLNDTLTAIDVRTGQPLWRKEQIRVAPYALSAWAGRVVYHNLDELVCLDAKAGRGIWRAPNVITSTVGAASTLVIHDDVVLFHGHGQADATADRPEPAAGTAKKAAAKKKPANRFHLTALSLVDGQMLWRRHGSPSLAAACTQPSDLFVANGIVWCGNSLDGVDVKTGEVRQTLSLEKLISPGHHYRCHRAKATNDFLIWPKRGAEFVDLNGSDHMRNDWLRAPCFTGLTPANGLLYVPPSQCFCYPGVKVSGFLAMSADNDSPDRGQVESPADRLRRGPAYLEDPKSEIRNPNPEDWPMHRRDIARSGSAKTVVPADLSPRWEVALDSTGTQPVVVGERVWVAEKDAHRLRCFNATDGQDVWSFTADGRIDSAPTVQDGLVFFGCRDGSVVCLRAVDGMLVWRFQAAPDPRQIVSFGQLESVWPVHGSVLVQRDVVYFAAGRSSFLDGGITVYGLDAKTGRVLYQHVLEGPWPDIAQDTGEPFAMEGALPDLLVGDGQDLYMQRIKFDRELNRLETRQESSLGELDMGTAHLVATGGFLDDTGFDRLYWMHSHRWPGFYFSQYAPKSGQLVVFDERTVYAVKYFYRRIQWSPAFYPGDQGYLLFADDIGCEPQLEDASNAAKTIAWLPKEAATDAFRRGGRGVEKGTGYVRQQPAKWQTMIPLRIRAMVLAGDCLFAAGIPDVVDPADPLAAFEGRKGALLQVLSAADGSLLKSYPLSSLPVFDGLSAAHGRLYLATADGKLICFGAPAGS
jgi:outer membrane protein assembly factor BamB